MSQWVPNSKSITQSQENGPSSSSSSEKNAPSSAGDSDSLSPTLKKGVLVRFLGWASITPFFLSAFFFLSLFFANFSPLPLLVLYRRKGKLWALLAACTNGVMVGLFAGGLAFAVYLVFVITLSITLSEFLIRKKSLEKSALMTLGSVTGVGILVSLVYSYMNHIHPIQEIQSQFSLFFDLVVKSGASRSIVMNPTELDEFKRNQLIEFPSTLGIFSLILIWTNLVILLKVNPNHTREALGFDLSYFRKWKTPQYLVWPVIMSGALLLVNAGIVSDIAINIFKFLMAVYAIQGISILSHFFHGWGVRGSFRFAGYLVSILFMMPLVLSLGFFDLWFDFRAKFRQS